jgi:hypothetical protein
MDDEDKNLFIFLCTVLGESASFWTPDCENNYITVQYITVQYSILPPLVDKKLNVIKFLEIL